MHREHCADRDTWRQHSLQRTRPRPPPRTSVSTTVHTPVTESTLSCNHKYCQQFLKEVDVALDQSKWHTDKCLLRYFSDVAFI